MWLSLCVWVSESFTQPIPSKTRIHLGTKHSWDVLQMFSVWRHFNFVSKSCLLNCCIKAILQSQLTKLCSKNILLILPLSYESIIMECSLNIQNIHIYIYIYAFSRCFYPKRLTVHSGYAFFLSVCLSNTSSFWNVLKTFILLCECLGNIPFEHFAMLLTWNITFECSLKVLKQVVTFKTC